MKYKNIIVVLFFAIVISPSAYGDITDKLKALGIETAASETGTDDPQIRQAILKHIPEYDLETDAEQSRRLTYHYNKVDLNGDNAPEVIVYLTGSYVCGSGGCNVLLLRQKQGAYEVLSEMTLGNVPVVVGTHTTKGWRDLYFYVAGGGAIPGFHVMKFDGKTYPDNPSVEPDAPKVDGTAYLSDADSAKGWNVYP